MKPFLKWAGNKYRLLHRIGSVLPSGKRLIEPFAGSAAISLNTEHQKYLLADANPDLIALYKNLQEHKDDFIRYTKSFFNKKNNSEDRYYYFREKFNASKDDYERSALFIYFNRHGFNGLCRYNSKGEFNVPFGLYKKPYFPKEEMTYFAKKMKNSTFINAHFTQSLAKAKPGDIVYCDPPYDALSKTANFTNYSGQSFGEEDQKELCRWAEKLAENDIPVVISNHDTPFIRKLYKKAKISRFPVTRTISCDPNNRKKVYEVLALFTKE